MLSIIIPTHNEEKRVEPTLRALLSFLKHAHFNYEIVVVDDGTDATSEIVRQFAEENENKRIKLMHFPKRLGKGGAVKKGFLAARGDCLLYDADASTPPNEIPKLVEGLKTHEIVVGSRYAPGARARIQFHRRLAAKAFNALANALFALGVSDTQCGFKALRARAAKTLARELVHTGFEFDVELLARAKKHGFRVKEVAIEWRHVAGGPLEKSFLEVLKTAFKMLFGLVKLRFEL